MKFWTGLLAVVLLLSGVGASQAVVRIADGRITGREAAGEAVAAGGR